MDHPLRVALLSYQGQPHCGGQGVYLRHLSRELSARGHHVEVLCGQPYPELEPGPALHRLSSLGRCYRDDDPFRMPRLREFRDWIDVLEVISKWTGAFPEPLSFSLRTLRELHRRRGSFDLVHDNQVLGYGMLGIHRLGLPLVTTIHHPTSIDRRIELRAARGVSKLSMWRCYSFVRMQSRVARRVGDILTASESSRRDICADFKVPPARVHVIPLGVDTRLFHPRTVPRAQGQIVAVASTDSPIKGVAILLHAVAKLATQRDVRLTVVSKLTPRGATDRLVGELSLRQQVRFVHGVSDNRLAELLASAEIAVVPSLYEGFSLPALEHMASGTPLIVSRTGALPEVVGDAAVQVPPGDAEALATALRELHDSAQRRGMLGEAGWRRVQERFAWPAVAKATEGRYAAALARCAAARATHAGAVTKGAEPR